LFCFQGTNLTWQSLSGLNRVTESAGKELLLAQITESPCQGLECKKKSDQSQPNPQPKSSQKIHVLKHVQVEEMLVRRFVPSQERCLEGPSSTKN
jgi:hypothetical protein